MSKEIKQPKKQNQMHGPMAMMQAGEKARNFKGTMKKLLSYLNVYKLSIIVV